MYRRGVTASTTTRKSASTLRAQPPARAAQRAEGAPLGSRTSHRTPISLTLEWVGRGEPWVRITVDGQQIMRPGTLALFELVLQLNGWERH